jgi:hypothetical protein
MQAYTVAYLAHYRHVKRLPPIGNTAILILISIPGLGRLDHEKAASLPGLAYSCAADGKRLQHSLSLLGYHTCSKFTRHANIDDH